MATPVKEKVGSLTDREMEILGKAWKCMKTTPEVDYQKLAAECNMSNVGSASNAWARIKKKLFPDGMPSPAKGGANNGTPGTPSGSRKRKSATSIAIEAATPTKGGDAKNGDIKNEGSGSGDEANGFSAPMKGTPKRRRAGAGGSDTNTPQTPKTPKTPKALMTPKTPATVGRGKKAPENVKTEEDGNETEEDELAMISGQAVKDATNEDATKVKGEIQVKDEADEEPGF